MTFEARFVEAYENKYTANRFLADPDAEPRCVMSFAGASIDRPPDEYYVEINDQANSVSNGLDSVQLFRERIEVRVLPKLIEKFGQPELAHVTVNFQFDDAQFAPVLAMARKILEVSPDTLSIQAQ